METESDLYPDGPAAIAVEGQVLRCKYAGTTARPSHGHMRFTDGAWEWNREAELKAETADTRNGAAS